MARLVLSKAYEGISRVNENRAITEAWPSYEGIGRLVKGDEDIIGVREDIRCLKG